MTRIAVIADVHGNSHALAAVLEEVARCGADAIAFLGDYVSDCADPDGVLALVRGAAEKWPCWILRGNREEYQVQYRAGGEVWEPSSRTGSLYYTALRLTEGDLRWFEQLPVSLVATAEGCPPMLLCHGSREKTRVLLTPGSPELEWEMARTGESLALLGHSHYAFVTRIQGTLAVNPGALGLPTGGDPRAPWAMVCRTGGEWRAELRRTAYDVEAAVAQMEQRGMVDMARWWARGVIAGLRRGENTLQPLVQRAMALHREGGREMEDCFEMAGREMNL